MLLMVLHLHLNIFPLHQVCRCTKYSVDDFMLKPSKLHEHKKWRAVWPLIIYMKKNLRIWLAENKCIFHVTQVQITSRAGCQNFACVDFLWCVFHVNYEKVTSWFLMQFGVNKYLYFFSDYKLHLPYGLTQFCCLWKIHTGLLINTKLHLKSCCYCTYTNILGKVV